MSKIMDNIPEEKVNALRKQYNNKPRNYVKTNSVEVIDNAIERFGKESVELALIVKNNAEIRRFTSKNIIAALTEGEENAADHNIHVEFLWNKFKVTKKVKDNTLSTEYLYTESFFIKSLIKSFEQFSENASQTIGAFANKYNVNTD